MLLHLERFCAGWIWTFPKASGKVSVQVLLELARLVECVFTVFKVALNASKW